MSEHGEWLSDWEDADDPCGECGGPVQYRLFRRLDDSEVYLHKCQDCGDTVWVDA